MRGSEMPADFMASSSLFSPRLPIVMMAAKRVASGRAMGMFMAAAYPNNSRITPNSSPLPTRSSMYLQRKFIRKMNATMKNVRTIGPMYDFRMNLSRVFTIRHGFSATQR